MKRTYKYIIPFFILFYCQIVSAIEDTDNLKATWAGIEVFGVNKEDAQKIRELLPIKVGDSFILSEKEKYRSMCNIIKEKMKIADADCSFVIYGNDKAFFDVEITQKGAKKNIFRTIPKKQGSIAILPKELNLLYDQWDKKMYSLITNGTLIKEDYSNGFLDFDHPTLHKLAIEMSKYAYIHNDKLLDIVRYSPDVNERCKAATLLAWAKHPEEDLTFILKWDLLNDPDQGVRNYLARSFSLLMSEVKNEALLKNLIPVYCKQATLPTHTDRNKALFSLLGILETNPKLVSTMNSECRNTLTYISEMSILENVGDIAKEILVILDKESNHG